MGMQITKILGMEKTFMDNNLGEYSIWGLKKFI